MKRFLSFIMALCLLLSLVPTSAFATKETPAAQVRNDELSVEGVSALGNMLAKEIQESQQTATEDKVGFTVLDLRIEGNTAYVSFETLETVNLVVALYTEDGVQMICSGKTEVSADQKQAEIAIEGTIPEYFFARAFLLDTYDNSPLCKSYATPMYTAECRRCWILPRKTTTRIAC